MHVSIPRSHKEALLRWFAKDAASAAKIEAVVSNATLGASSEGLGKELAAALQVPAGEAAELAQVFLTMAASANDLPQDVRKDFPEAVVAHVYEHEIPPEDSLPRLQRLLEVPALRYSGKAWRLIHDRPQLFTDCRVITDLRPLFGDDDTEIRAVAVTHQLRISFDTPSRDPGNFYIALDSADLRKLRAAIDRALAKQVSLEVFSRTAGVNLVKEESS